MVDIKQVLHDLINEDLNLVHENPVSQTKTYSDTSHMVLLTFLLKCVNYLQVNMQKQ